VNLEETIRVLYDADVDLVLIGGGAMQLQGSAYMTEDLVFCYSRTRQNIAKLARAMAPYHPRLRAAPENLPFHFDAPTIERGMNFTLETDLGAIDFLGELAGFPNYEAVKNSSEIILISGMQCRVLSLPGLIRAKQAAGRKKDLEAVVELKSLLQLREKTNLK
jgi:predicted nucleotidyltransferase